MKVCGIIAVATLCSGLRIWLSFISLTLYILYHEFLQLYICFVNSMWSLYSLYSILYNC